jgi:hypothetical protein
VSRPIAVRRGSRVSPRRLAIAALGVAGALLVSACASGQIAETADEVSAVDGSSGNAGNLDLRDVTLAFPSTGFYRAGSNARLQLVVVNNSAHPDVLVGVRSPNARGAVSASGAAPALPVTVGTRVRVPIGAQGSVIVDGAHPSVTLVGLTRKLLPSQTIRVTFQFARSGAVTLPVPVSTPTSPVPRGG